MTATELVADRATDAPALARARPRRCPVCDTARATPLFDNRMAPLAGIEFDYPVVACDACGMVYASRAPDAATLAWYYSELSKYDFPTSRDDVNAFDLQRARVTAAFTRRVLDPDARLLDVGCSIGLYLSALAESGWTRVQGIDPAPGSARAAKTLFDVDVAVGDASAFERYAEFDGIALLAVLEHLLDPRTMIDGMARAMKPGAILVVEIPDADAFGDYRDVGRAVEPFGEFSNEHINFFGAASLGRLAAQAGLKRIATERTRYLNGSAGLLAAFRKDAGQGTPDDTTRTTRSVRHYVDASSAAIERVEARLRSACLHERSSVLYGAGSHSARLLAQGMLAEAPIEVVLDRNRHLAGRRIGALPIASPTELHRYAGRPVIVSSFNAMKPIVAELEARHAGEVVALY